MSTRARSEDTEVDYRPSWDHPDRNVDNQASSETALGARRSSTANIRHRNKPTLSCLACVSKKTKCDRIRPTCHACRNRHTACEYQPSTTNGSPRSGGRSDEGLVRQADPLQMNNIVGQFPPARSLNGTGTNQSTLNHISPPNSGPLQDTTRVLSTAAALDGQSVDASVRQNSPDEDVVAPTLLSTIRSFLQGPNPLFDLFGMTAQHPFSKQ